MIHGNSSIYQAEKTSWDVRSFWETNTGQTEKKRARVVAKEFSQRPGIDFQDTFAPVARLGSLRMLIALSAQMGLSISQLDISLAYLLENVDHKVHMKAPKLLEEMLIKITLNESDKNIRSKAKLMLSHYQQGRQICLLRKTLYGLPGRTSMALQIRHGTQGRRINS